LIGGDADERTHLQELLRGVRRGWERQTYGLVRLIVFTYGVQRAGKPVSASCRGAALYLGVHLARHADADGRRRFPKVTAALAFPVDNLSGLSQWRASVERVMALQDCDLAGLEQKLGDEPHRGRA
jgi:putative ATP-binding cassette transporter